jgi:hypothetical protein
MSARVCYQRASRVSIGRLMVSSVIGGYGANPYAAAGAATPPLPDATARKDAADPNARSTGASVSVTLSAEAMAALAAQTDTRSTDAVVSAARASLDKLLADAKATSALVDGKPTISVAGLDRRSLYAIASNQDGKFSTQEQVVAALQMKTTSDASLSTPTAVMRVTGDYSSLYSTALANLELAGPEERASSQWAQTKAALTEGLKQATQKAGAAPSGIAGDTVAAYLKAIGGVVANPQTRDIDSVASDVRAVLDRQQAAATQDGASTGADNGAIDFSKFDGRSLAAVALNKGAQFSTHEVAQAAAEVTARNHDTISSALASSQGADGASFGTTLITQYSAMSPEERTAAGWTPAFYDKLMANQALSEKLATMFGGNGSASGAGAGVSSLADYLFN